MAHLPTPSDIYRVKRQAGARAGFGPLEVGPSHRLSSFLIKTSQCQYRRVRVLAQSVIKFGSSIVLGLLSPIEEPVQLPPEVQVHVEKAEQELSAAQCEIKSRVYKTESFRLGCIFGDCTCCHI
eukprot:5386957-Amphidinium_carterae.1